MTTPRLYPLVLMLGINEGFEIREFSNVSGRRAVRPSTAQSYEARPAPAPSINPNKNAAAARIRALRVHPAERNVFCHSRSQHSW
jgi:hypothetical protein